MDGRTDGRLGGPTTGAASSTASPRGMRPSARRPREGGGDARSRADAPVAAPRRRNHARRAVALSPRALKRTGQG
eukprot:scaffold3965_cov414-Prasinococcus_capsulatus_cf.AAC.1